MVDVMCGLEGGCLRLPDGFYLVQEVGLFPQHIYHILTSWISFLVGVDSRYKDLHSHKMSCGHVSSLRSDYYALLVSDKAGPPLLPPSQLGPTKGHLVSLQVENHLNHRDGRGQCVSDKEPNDITYSWSGVLSSCPLCSTGSTSNAGRRL